MDFLHERVFDPILNSASASETLKRGVRYTIMRMNERDSDGMIRYFWSAVVGTDPSIKFAERMRAEKFVRFEEVIDDFRARFVPRPLVRKR